MITLKRNSFAVLTITGVLAAAIVAARAGPIDDAQAHIKTGNVSRALEILRPLADSGNADAQAVLGNLYRDGVGLIQDFRRAADLYRRSAELGNAKAHNGLGHLHASGLGVERDFEAALAHYRVAAEAGDPQHQFDLAVFLDTGLGDGADPQAAAQWYEKAAAQGHVDSQANLGLLYYQGRGVEKSPAKALKLLSIAAEAGHARAQNNLGLIYVKGEGVERDYKLAAELFAKAAEQGLAPAMTNLGVMYDNGFGVEQSDEKAIELYRRAGRKGEQSETALLKGRDLFFDPRFTLPDEGTPGAQFEMGAQKGDPVAMFLAGYLAASSGDHITSARWFEVAADKGLSSAMANLGLLYFRGQGVPQDHVMAYVWLNRAVASGFRNATAARDIVASSMTALQLNEAQSLAGR